MDKLRKRSTKCGSSACIEVALNGETVLVSDSKDPAGESLGFDKKQWAQITTKLGAMAGSTEFEVQFPLEDDSTVVIAPDATNSTYPYALMHSAQPNIIQNYSQEELTAFALGVQDGEFAPELLPQQQATAENA